MFVLFGKNSASKYMLQKEIIHNTERGKNMSENQVAQYTNRAIQTAVSGDWAAAYPEAQKAYNNGVRVPAITWILGYCYAEGIGVSQNTAMAHHYLTECADTQTNEHDLWIDKARGYLCIHSIGNHPKFGSNEQAAGHYGELLYYDAESDFREEALRVLCIAYGDPTSDAFNAQKGAMFIRQALQSTDANTRQVVTPLYTGLRQIIARDIANKYNGNGPYSPGITTIRANEIWPLIKDATSSSSSSSGTSGGKKSGGCYIATCIYGSYDCPQVWTLRRYRDQVLSTTFLGRSFIRTYYAISPIVVKYCGKMRGFRNFWRNLLDKWIYRLNKQGFASTPYKDV